MAFLLPEKNITLVLPYASQKVEDAILKKTLSADITIPQRIEDPNEGFWFRGDIEEKKFVLSIKNDSFHSYTPMIKGSIESTSNGSIVFLQYKLFKTTKLFMLIWSALTLFLTLLFSFGIPETHLALTCIALLIANHIVATVSFQKQVKITQSKFNQLFDDF